MDRPTPLMTPTPGPPDAPPGLFAVLRDTTFRSLKHADYRLYFTGQIVSFTGTWVQNAALMWLVFDLTRNPLWPPMLLVAQVGPTVLFGTLGGTLADRVPKRRLILTTQCLYLSNACLLTILVAAGWANPWLILVLQAFNGLVQAADLPARLAFVPDLIPKPDLINAVSLNSLLFNCARAVGPAIAGLLFVAAEANRDWFPTTSPVVTGAIACFSLNTISYAAVLVALSRISVPGIGPDRAARGAPLDGIRYVIARPMLGAILLLTGGLSVFGWPVVTLFPAYTQLVLGLGVRDYTTLVSSLGAGALIGALFTATFGTEARRGLFLVGGSGLSVVGLTGLTVAPGLAEATAAAACIGFGLILFLSTGQSALQLAAGDKARGRVMALWAMTLSGSAPVGHLLAGAVAAQVGVTPVLAGMAGGSAVVVVATAALTLARGWIVVEPAEPGSDDGSAEK